MGLRAGLLGRLSERRVDAFAQLALMAKAKLVFESAETFLSFPALSPLSYLPDQLRFGSAAEMTVQDLAEASEFARITNQVPRSVIAPIDEGEYLWDIYREVLETGRVATRTMRPGDVDAYRAAMDLLYVAGEGGLRTDSEKLRTYKQHRDAVIEAQEEYKNQQLTAEAATDPAVVARWKNEDEPRLRGVVREREDAWVRSGFKGDIERAQQVELASAAGDATRVWSEWRSSFLDDLDLATDTNQIRFAITGYSPIDIFESDNWPRFTLTADEMARLADQAPAVLREIFAAGSGATEIENVSFEYRSVAVIRPWFQSGLFRARFWRLPDGAEPMSDGAEEASGRCPAYVSALVFARNVVVKYRERAGGATEAGTPARFLRLDAAMLDTKFMHLALRAAPVAATPSPPMEPVHMTVAARVPSTEASRASVRLRATTFGARMTPATPMLVARPATRLQISGLLDRQLFTPVTAATPAEPAAEPAPSQPPARTGEVMVLALICKRIPRSPDPDPTLSWG